LTVQKEVGGKLDVEDIDYPCSSLTEVTYDARESINVGVNSDQLEFVAVKKIQEARGKPKLTKST
jgi:hypothetical protein